MLILTTTPKLTISWEYVIGIYLVLWLCACVSVYLCECVNIPLKEKKDWAGWDKQETDVKSETREWLALHGCFWYNCERLKNVLQNNIYMPPLSIPYKSVLLCSMHLVSLQKTTFLWTNLGKITVMYCLFMKAWQK